MKIKMKQSKLDFEYSNWENGVDIRPNDLYTQTINLSYSEFMELVEAMYAIYCRIRMVLELPVNLPIHRLPAKEHATTTQSAERYSIAISLFSDFSYFPPSPNPEKSEITSLKNLLCNKGSKEDLEIIKKLAQKKGRHGIADLIDVFLEER